ncbi:hypothetical protein BGZ46_002292 [Entomortierella lignicola]|nr:hypothetical protein BGZ46_002292 [Entomortierella lignicola]
MDLSQATTKVDGKWIEWERSKLKEYARMEDKKLEWEKEKYALESERAERKDTAMMQLEKFRVERESALEMYRFERQSALDLELESKKITMVSDALIRGISPSVVAEYWRSVDLEK